MISCFYVAASEGQVLELRVLQVHLHLRRDERADDGGGGAVGRVVLGSRLLPPAHPARQGQIRIRTYLTHAKRVSVRRYL